MTASNGADPGTRSDGGSKGGTSGGSGGGSARRFVALPVPPEVRERVASALPDRDADRGHGLRWARPEGWHVTLAFLGQISDDQVSAITDAVASGVASVDPLPARLAVEGAGRFGRKVLWLGVDDTPAGSLATLAEAVRRALGSVGLEVDRKPLSPHVTLARAGRRAVSRTDVEACRPPEGLAWQPGGVELWRSRLGDGPARYEVDARIHFDGSTT